MALDQQRNWTISMADNLQAVQQRSDDVQHEQKSIPLRPSSTDEDNDDGPKSMNYHPTEAAYLPDEIILQILAYVARSPEAQKSLYTCCLLSRQWYNTAVPLLYEHPKIYGKNYDPFVRAICPSINLHVRKSPLSGLVKVLDLGFLVHQSTKSLTARLLGRTKENLVHFRAPQASFAINCYPALSKCRKLQGLDLSLVSESTPLQTLFNTVKSLDHLTQLRLPRSSGFGANVEPDSIVWPPKLRDLYLSGGIDAHFLYGIVHFPPSLQHLTLEHCPRAKSHAVKQMLSTIARADVPLKSLAVSHLPRLGFSSMDPLLGLFPDLEELSVSVDYITPAIFNPTFQEWQCETPDFTTHKLQVLELTNSGNPGIEDKFSPIDIILTLDEGSFPGLRHIKIAKSLGWHSGDTGDETDALVDKLQELGQKDWEEKKGIYADMSVAEWKQADYKAWAGVWIIEG